MPALMSKTAPPAVPMATSNAPGVPSRFTRKRAVDDRAVAKGQGSVVNELKNGFGGDITEVEIAQRLLVGGFVQSYVDFYNLTHRADPNVIPENPDVFEKIKISVSNMMFIRDNLVQAETARRLGDTSKVYVAFTKLAEHFFRLLDFGTAVFFYEKCLDIATLTSDIRAEMTANHSLGVVYQNTGKNNDMARRCHERHNELAESVEAAEEIIKANAELFKVYTVLADTCYEDGDVGGALDLYGKALQSSKEAWNKAAEADANGKLGTLLLNLGDVTGAIPFLRSQSEIAADNGDAESRCRACSSLALAYDALGKSEQALAELILVSTISEQAGDLMLQSQASLALGTLYSKVGKLTEAMDALQRHFNLLKQIFSKQKAGQAVEGKPVTPKDIEVARSYVGIAKGNMLMGSYIAAIQHDFSSVLGWKLNRGAFDAPSTTNTAANTSTAVAFTTEVAAPASTEGEEAQAQAQPQDQAQEGSEPAVPSSQ